MQHMSSASGAKFPVIAVVSPYIRYQINILNLELVVAAKTASAAILHTFITHPYKNVDIRTHIHIHIHLHLHLHLHLHIHMHMHMHIHSYTYMHTYARIRVIYVD